MNEHAAIQEFSLFGGPLQSIGRRLGLVRGSTNTLRLGVALGLLGWGVLVLLALLEGYSQKLFSLTAVGIHVRLLVVIPLFFLCETWEGPQMAEYARYIVRSGLVPEVSLPALAADIRRVGRLKDSWLVELLFVLAAFALPAIEAITDLPRGTGSWVSVLGATGGTLTWMNVWYLAFCLPLFRFLMLRWLWRLGLWCYFLWRIEKLELRLIPTHPDGVAGLGYTELVQEDFAPLALAISAIFSAQFAEEIVSRRIGFEALYYLVPMVLLLNAVLFIGPLLIFLPKLTYCRWTGMSHYLGMASRYVSAFDHKWIQDKNATGESQLGTADLQSLADLTNSINVVREMRLIPASQRLLMELAACVIAPLVPLLLLRFPIGQVATQLFRMLTGL